MSELIESLKELLPISSVGIALAGFTYAFAKYLNETVNEDLRMRVSQWFLGDTPKFAWQSHMLTFFDSFFGEKAFSWKRLRRVAAIILTLSVLWAIYIVSLLSSMRHRPPDIGDFITIAVVSIFTLPVAYLSVLKTRLMLRAAARLTPSAYMMPLLLTLDIGVTAILIGLGMVIVFLVFLGMNNASVVLLEFGKAKPIVQWQSFSLEGVMRFQWLARPSAAFSVIHTIWLLIYFLATLLAKGAAWLSARLPSLAKMLSQERIEKSPITLIGEFGAAIVLFAFLAGGIIMPGTHQAATKKAETAAAHTRKTGAGEAREPRWHSGKLQSSQESAKTAHYYTPGAVSVTSRPPVS